MKLIGAVAIASALSSAGCFFSEGSVTRIYSGKTVEERFIAPEAYAHYAQAILEESAGDDHSAEQEYLQALDIDPDSADTWTRLGAVRCRLRSAFDEAFAEAEDLDREYAPLWRERARCALLQGDPTRALAWGKLAVGLDPDDARASLAVTDALQKLGRSAEAKHWLEALLLRSPGAKSTELRPAQKTSHRARRSRVEEVDRALLEKPRDEARAVALRHGVRLAELATRAAALGLGDIAETESERVLVADPDDADAWVAALVSADLAGDETRFAKVARQLGPDPLALGPLAQRLFAELLARRAGPDAARAFLRAGPLLPTSDELARRVEGRLKSLGVSN